MYFYSYYFPLGSIIIDFQNRWKCYLNESQNLCYSNELHILKPWFEASCLLQLVFSSYSLNFHRIVFPQEQWFPMITNGGKNPMNFLFFSASQDGQEKTKLMKTESRSGGTRLFQATSQTLPHTPSRLSNLKRNQAWRQSTAAIPHKRTFIFKAHH